MPLFPKDVPVLIPDTCKYRYPYMASDFIDEIKARDYSALSSGPNVIT